MKEVENEVKSEAAKKVRTKMNSTVEIMEEEEEEGREQEEEEEEGREQEEEEEEEEAIANQIGCHRM